MIRENKIGKVNESENVVSALNSGFSSMYCMRLVTIAYIESTSLPTTSSKYKNSSDNYYP